MRARLVALLVVGAAPVAFGGSAAGQTAEAAVVVARGTAAVRAPAGLVAPPRVTNPFGTETLLVSQSTTGERPAFNSFSYAPDVSGDGRFVVFNSSATNLVPGDTNFSGDLFLRDVVAGTTTRILTPAGEQFPFGVGRAGGSISADGRYVAFGAIDPANGHMGGDVYLYDRVLGTTRLVTVDPATGKAFGGVAPELSLDGDHLVFQTRQALDPRDTDGGDMDIYLLTISTGKFTRVSVGRPGAAPSSTPVFFSPSVDAHGDRVMFGSNSSEFVRGDTNGARDVFVRDLRSRTTTRVNLSSAGKQLQINTFEGQISGNGRVVTFKAFPRVVPADHHRGPDVFAHDLTTGRTRIVSVGPNEEPANGASGTIDIARDGHLIAFESNASTFLPGKTNTRHHVMFVRDMRAGTTRTCMVGARGRMPSGGFGTYGALSADGRSCVFEASASNLVLPPDANATGNVYLRH